MEDKQYYEILMQIDAFLEDEDLQKDETKGGQFS
jgi:hypothetical protein